MYNLIIIIIIIIFTILYYILYIHNLGSFAKFLLSYWTMDNQFLD